MNLDMYEVEQNYSVPVSVSNYFTTLALPKVGGVLLFLFINLK